MKKEEVRELHSLLVLSANFYVREEYGLESLDRPDGGYLDPAAFDRLELERYREIGVSAGHVHKSKKDHRRALKEVADALSSDIGGVEDNPDRRQERHYFDRNPVAEEIVRELYSEGEFESLTELSNSLEAAYSAVKDAVDEMVYRDMVEDRENGSARAVRLPGSKV